MNLFKSFFTEYFLNDETFIRKVALLNSFQVSKNKIFF